jgi:enoyl-CoA hydratase/carnithine racemase
MLTLDQVFSLAGTQPVALVVDGPIYYMIFNSKLNIITVEAMWKMNEILDTIEQSKGPAVLVTMSSSKVFCAGFDLKYWQANPMNMDI